MFAVTTEEVQSGYFWEPVSPELPEDLPTGYTYRWERTSTQVVEVKVVGGCGSNAPDEEWIVVAFTWELIAERTQ